MGHHAGESEYGRIAAKARVRNAAVKSESLRNRYVNKEEGDGYSSGEEEYNTNVEFDREMSEKYFTKGFTKAFN